jgi:hypothetical protein
LDSGGAERKVVFRESPSVPGSCAYQGSKVWFPDLRKDESFVDIDIMVKF